MLLGLFERAAAEVEQPRQAEEELPPLLAQSLAAKTIPLDSESEKEAKQASTPQRVHRKEQEANPTDTDTVTF